jgi:ABC-type transport system involved in multi-copper enzyme maturation permease subunit
MSMSQKSVSRRKVPAPVRVNTVFMGRTDFISTLLRLIGVELYKIRRRVMSIVLLSICLIAVIGTFAIIGFFSIALIHNGNQSGISTSTLLRLPASLNLATGIADNVGKLLIIILAGSIIGGEYSHGTFRLLLTRGPSRSQFVLMKIGAIVVCILVGFLMTVLVGIIVGVLLNPFTGIAQFFGFLTGAWILHAILYLLTAMLDLFIYAMLALCLATLGRSTAAGVAGAIAWALLEPVVSNLLLVIGSLNKGSLGHIISAIPDYLIGSNTGALLQNQSQYLFNMTAAPLSNLHALLVLAVYLAIFIGVAWYVIFKRDVVN